MGIGLSGLASNFNSAAYIEAIMKQEKIPLTNLQTKKENTTAYKNFFTTMNTKIATLKDAATALSDSSTYTLNTATSSDTTKFTVSAGDAAVAGTYAVNVIGLAKQHVLASSSFTTSGTFTADSNSILRIGGAGIDLSEFNGKSMDEALSGIAKKINLEAEGATASVVQTSNGNKTLVLTSGSAGIANEIDTTGSGSFWGFTEKQAAADAHISVNGIDIYSSTNEVKDAVPGVTLTLANTGTSTVKVNRDVDGIVSKISKFVTAYNDIVKNIRDNTTKSTKNSDGSLSLTLQGDPMLRDLQSQLNSWMNNIVGDKAGFRLLSDIGLEIDKGVTSASLMTGTITFDSAAFKAKMLENSDEVQKMLAGTTTSGTATGMGALFKDNLKSWSNSVDGIITSKIKGYDSEISYLSESIQNMSDHLDKREEALKKKYAALEVAMSSLNNQKTYVSSILASFTKSSD